MKRVERTLNLEDNIENALGHLCPKCGAVMEQKRRVLKLKDEQLEYDIWKCGYCGFRED
jgi:predicted RNA-binding Zn-ribbon protein involved in translation (DUF1610 family)